MSNNYFRKLRWIAALVMVHASAEAQLNGTSVHIPVQDANYARGASIILNNSGLLTFRASFGRVFQGTIPTVNFFYPGNFKAPDGGELDLIYHYVTPAGSLAVLSHYKSVLRRGIYFINGTTVREIAYTEEGAPGGGVFSSFGNPSANDAGQVAFAASTQGGPGSGIFLGDSTGLHAVALYTGNAPGGAGTFTGFSDEVIMTTGGKVAFYASTSGGNGGGIYLGTPSGVSLIPLTNQASTVLFNDSGQAMFHAHGNLYLGTTTSSHAIVSVGDAAPGGGTFSTIQHGILNNAGEVAFTAYVKRDTTIAGVFLWTPSGIRSIAQSGLAPGGGTFLSASLFNTFPVLNNDGQVAFRADTSSGGRLFLGDGTSLIKVVGAGDTVSGLIVQNVVLPAPEGGGSGHSAFNDQGQLVYDVVFKNSQGYFDELFVFTLDPAKPGSPGNISTRLPVGKDDNVLIEGFIVQGPAGSTKKIIVRAIGPALAAFGIPDALANPTLEIRNASNEIIARNNDWKTTQLGGLVTGDQATAISASGLAPSKDLESAIIVNLAPGSYTAIVRGAENTTGTGVVDAYDLSPASPARLVNFSTRGVIQPGDKLMIAGFIVQNGPVRAVVRAVGPSLTAFGIANALPDPTLQLRNQNGVVVRENDDWKTTQKQELESTGLQPTHNLEAALVETIQPGQYTAQVRGKGQASGIGVVQVYFVQ